MKVIKIIALSLAAVGFIIAIYGVSQLSDYRKADKAWQEAADQRNDFLRTSRDRSGAVEVGRAVDELSDVRGKLRARCQKVVIASVIPLALGLILGIVGLTRKPRGWMPLTSTLCAMAAGGLIGPMLAAGVF